jgi:sulfane dehydrogenase subunit SoxC
MDAKSVITNPSPQAPITHGQGADRHHRRGLVRPRHHPAWTFPRRRHELARRHALMGRARQVDAPLLLRLRLGRLAAAAAVARIDSTGYVQPTKSELREVRGENSIYHNNGIQTWHVKANGEVENVEVS